MARPRTAQHGTRSRYVAGCKCVHCTAANANYQRDYAREKYVPKATRSV